MPYRMVKDAPDGHWHFNTNCPAWPHADFYEAHDNPLSKPDEHLCPECAKLELTTWPKPGY